MSRRLRAIVILIGVMTAWGCTFVVTKDVIETVPPLTLAFIRVAIGSLLLLPFACRRYSRLPVPRQKLPWKTIVLMGFVGVAFYYAAFNVAMMYTSASQGALVQSSIPAATALVAILWLRERASRQRVAGIALSIAGVIVIFSAGGNGDAAAPVIGNLLMFASVVAWGIYTSLAKRVAHIDALILTAGITLAGALMLLPGAAVELSGQSLPQLTAVHWMQVLFLGVVASGLAYMLYNLALQDIDASQAGVFANLIPVVGVISGIVVLHEPLSGRAIVGGLIVMAGVWITGSERTS